MFTPEYLAEHHHTITGEDDGMSCQFCEVEGVGLKLYTTKRLRTNCARAQKFLNAHKLAPAVYGTINLPVNHPLNTYNHRFGYFTELAIPLKTIFHDIGWSQHSSQVRISFGLKNYQSFRRDFGDYWFFAEFKELENAMEKLGYIDEDVHHGNYGYLKNGTPVLIDMDRLQIDGAIALLYNN